MSEELAITDLAYGGDGVGRLADGRAAFVPFTAVGDHVRVQVLTEHRRFVRATIVELLTPGPDRTAPACPYYGTCPGCQYQHLARAAEWRAKEKQLRDLWQRLGPGGCVPPIALLAPSAEYGYRNKLSLHAASGSPPWGYLGADDRTVLPISRCPLAQDPINARLAELGAAPSGAETLTLRADARGTVCHWWNDAPPATMLTESLAGKDLAVPAGAFYQVNPPALEAIVAWLRELAPPLGGDALVDAYCGVGVFGLALADRFGAVFGIEQQSLSLDAARALAVARGLPATEFHAGAVERVLPRLLRQRPQTEAVTVLLDPPRGGCDEAVIEALRERPPATLIYISCHPAMLARDLRRLAGSGLGLRALALADMFPRTAHFETVAVLGR